MKIIKNLFIRSTQGKTVQFDLVKKFWLSNILTVGFLILGVFLFGFLLSEGMSSTYMQERLGFSFFSGEFFRVLITIIILGFFASVGATVMIGVPVGKTLKTLLHVIRDANEKLSRGKLDFRLKIRGYIELEEISNQFNRMAQRTEKQVESLQRLINENKELLEGAEEAASSEERRKIARELHDAISQQLFAISTTVSAIPKVMEKDPEKAKKYFVMIENMVSMAQQELRALIMHLRPVNLEEDCLKDGIEKLLNELDAKHESIEIYQDLHNIQGLAPGLENNIFRVIQEAVSNILRHSKASKFSVKLFQKEKVLNLVIEDNGIGMDISDEKKSSYGMMTMRERIEELGGRFDVLSFPQKGTRIEVRVPIGLQSTFGKQKK